MYSISQMKLIEKQKVYACADAACVLEVQAVSPSTASDPFIEQTGWALITLGKMFVNVPPFNDYIDRNTGELLISLGNKLKARK